MASESVPHLANSQVQLDVEAVMLMAHARERGIDALLPRKVSVGEGLAVQVDGVAADDSAFVEAYARQGKLKGAQLKKVAQDILKLSLVGAQYPRAEVAVLFASEEARASVVGWVAHAAHVHGIKLYVVDVGEGWVSRILTAQANQVKGMMQLKDPL